MQTSTIPTPLKSGNIITDGTVDAILVITKLMMQRDNALAAAKGKDFFALPFSPFLNAPSAPIIKNGTKKE